MTINFRQVRQVHRWLAPIMVAPLLLTLFTGMLFQVAIATGRSSDFLWLLALHRGHFGQLNLEMIYPFLNGLGLLVMVISGLLLWLKTPRKARRQR